MNEKSRTKTITYSIITILTLISLVWLLIYRFVWVTNWKTLLLMFIFELLSTFTFQTRIWFTSKGKIILASFIGGLSWIIAGTQGMLLITESFGFEKWVDFAIKLPIVFNATVVGILLTHLNIRKNKKDEMNGK